MTLVAVIVAKNKALEPGAVEDVRANLPGTQEARWLCETEACEIAFEPAGDLDKKARRNLAAGLRQALPFAADVAVLPVETRRKKLLVADMDSTLIEQECLDELARQAGFYGQVAAITERAMRGEIEFEAALRERVALLQGLPETIVADVIAKKITLTRGARTLVATMKVHGAFTVLVSGGFTLFTKPIAAVLGFDTHVSNMLECENGLLTGKVREPILGCAGKRDTLLASCRAGNIIPEDALAIGDGANDISMIESVGLGIAYRAKPVLADAADAEIHECDLSTALYFQGYTRGEFTGAE